MNMIFSSLRIVGIASALLFSLNSFAGRIFFRCSSDDSIHWTLEESIQKYVNGAGYLAEILNNRGQSGDTRENPINLDVNAKHFQYILAIFRNDYSIDFVGDKTLAKAVYLLAEDLGMNLNEKLKIMAKACDPSNRTEVSDTVKDFCSDASKIQNLKASLENVADTFRTEGEIEVLKSMGKFGLLSAQFIEKNEVQSLKELENVMSKEIQIQEVEAKRLNILSKNMNRMIEALRDDKVEMLKEALESKAFTIDQRILVDVRFGGHGLKSIYSYKHDESGQSLGSSPLAFAAMFGSINCVRILIEEGATRDLQSKFTSETDTGKTPKDWLMVGVNQGWVKKEQQEAITKLLEE